MIAIPAWVWRGGPVRRAVSVGVPVGVVLAVLAYADSGLVLAGVVVLVVVGAGCGALAARRMAKYWPGALELPGAVRVDVARATRQGHQIGDAALVPAVVEYRDGLHKAREQLPRWRWFVWLLGAVALAVAVIDSVTAPIPSAVVSWVYVGFFAVELFWWPGRQEQLLANADRAAELARQLEQPQAADEDG